MGKMQKRRSLPRDDRHAQNNPRNGGIFDASNKKDKALKIFFKNFFILPWIIYTGSAAPLEFSDGNVLRDAEIEDVFHDFSDPILRVAGINPKDVQIYLVSSPEINAFSALGNLIVLNTGLILKTQNVDELLAVLAHEIGHLAGRHVIRTLEAINQAQNRGLLTAALGTLLAIATGRADAAIAGLMGANQIAERSFLAYSRDQESAADQAAIRYLSQLHWPLQGLVSLTKHFQDQDLLSDKRQDLYIRTHPLGKDRLMAAEIALQHHPDGKLPPEFQEKYHWVKVKISAYMLPAKQVLQKYSPPKDARGYYACAIACYRLGDHANALTHVNKLLSLEKNHPNPYVYELRAQILFDQGKLREGLTDIQKALSLSHPPSPLLKVLAAQMMIESSDKVLIQQAIDLLETIKLKEQDNGETWRLLSIAYGKQENMGQMSLCLAEMALLQGDFPRAKNQAQRALHFLPPQTPATLRTQDILREIGNRQ